MWKQNTPAVQHWQPQGPLAAVTTATQVLGRAGTLGATHQVWESKGRGGGTRFPRPGLTLELNFPTQKTLIGSKEPAVLAFYKPETEKE